MILEIVCGVAALLYLFHLYISWNWDYWATRGIPYMKPTPFVGSLGPLITRKTNFLDFDINVYKYFKGHKIGGYFEGRTPILWINDPELIKLVMVKDFDHFVDHRVFGLEDEVLSNMLFGATGQHWKDLRAFTSPTFTSGKMKRMLPCMLVCSTNCVEYLKKYAESGEPVQMKETFGRLTVDVVSGAAYGINVNSFLEQDAVILRMAKNLVDPGAIQIFFMLLFFLIPKIAKHLPFLELLPKVPVKFFSDVTLSTIEEREKNGIHGQDFLQLIADARKGELKDDDDENEEVEVTNTRKGNLELTDKEVVAQGLQFFFAGYETSSSFLAFLTYELAVNPDVQGKLREEIQTVLEKHGEVTYDALQEMEYMDMVFSEVQRLHPILTRLDRTCTKDYKIPGTNHTVEKGSVIAISSAGFNYDPEYFPDPRKFDPDRFTKEEKAKRNQYVFMPFGTGPRGCIGKRFALLELKAVTAKMLSTMELLTCEKTQIPLQYGSPVGVLKAKDGVWLKMKKL